MKKKHPIFQRAVLSLFVCTLLAQTASAQISISPSQENRSMKYQISGGESITGTALIRNTSDEEIQVKLSANDGKRSSDGNFAVKKSYEDQLGLGLWTVFKQEIITLEPKAEKTVEFVITLPVDIPPGVYAGGLSIEKYQPVVANEEAFKVKVNARIVIPFYVDVPGTKINKVTLASLQYQEFRGKEHFFSISLVNEGNTAVIIKPKIIIDGFFGLYHEELTDDDIYLYSGDKTTFRMNWDKVPFGGFFTATAVMENYENNIVDNKLTYIDTGKLSIPVNVIPWLWIGLSILLLAGITGTVIYKKSTFDKLVKKSEKYQIQQGDTLTGLAKKFGVNWKLLAKLNKLEEPYALDNIKELLIPRKKKV